MSVVAALRAAYAAQRSPAPTTTPVPYTSDAATTWLPWSPGDGRSEQLATSTQESTLLSVLDLVASKVGEVEWEARRPVTGPQPVETPLVTPDQHLAVQMWHQPNDFMDGQHLRQMCTWHYDCVGEIWIVADRFPGSRVVRSLWPVRPDRMTPVPHPRKYLTGYVYTGPPGSEPIPLDLDEVLRITRPHPTDPHRGLGLVGALMLATGTSLTAQAWIRKFFGNDARPGGLVELGLEHDQELTDDEFKILKRRWNEDHQGVSRANRVGFLERGTWKDVQPSMKDMQFTELRTLTRDQILEMFRIHKHSMGISEDVNRANAVAAKSLLAENTISPRLTLWRKLGNGKAYRDLFPGTTPIDFTFCNPAPLDPEVAAMELTAKTTAYATLITAGVDPDDAADVVGLPRMRHTSPQADAPSEGGSIEARRRAFAVA